LKRPGAMAGNNKSGRKKTVYITKRGGVKIAIADLARETGIRADVLRSRLKYNPTYEELTRPVKPRPKVATRPSKKKKIPN